MHKLKYCSHTLHCIIHKTWLKILYNSEIHIKLPCYYENIRLKYYSVPLNISR